MKQMFLLCCAAVILCSCHFTPERKTIGVAIFSMQNNFAANLCQEFRRDMNKRGYNVVFTDANGDNQTQIKQLDGLINDKVDLLVIMPVDAKKVDPAILRANEAKIPVFTFDTGCDVGNLGKVVSHVATDNYNGGRKAAELMHRALNGKGCILVVGTGDMEAVVERAKGVSDELADSKSGIDVAESVPGSGDAITTSRLVFQALKKHPDISGIIALTDTAAGGVMRGVALLSDGKDVKVIGFGETSFVENNIREGKLYAGLGQSHTRLAAKAAEMIDEYMKQEVRPEPQQATCTMIEADQITAETLKK